MLKVKSRKDIIKFCKANKIEIKDFNEPVELDSNIVDCSGLFSGCRSFNQPVEIPGTVKMCVSMFSDCYSFNESVTFKATPVPSGSKELKPTIVTQLVEDCSMMFKDCKSFNKSIKIPNDVLYTQNMFDGCFSLNSEILISDTVTNCNNMFKGCLNMSSDIKCNYSQYDSFCWDLRGYSWVADEEYHETYSTILKSGTAKRK